MKIIEQLSARQRRTAVSVFLTVVAVVLAVHSFLFGLKRELHHVVPPSIRAHGEMMAIAISDLEYNLNGGYLYYPEIYETLRVHGMSEHDSRFPDNMTDPELVNTALKAAASMDRRRLGRQRDWRHATPLLIPTDLGLADYYKLAFRLFGYRVEGFYHLYWVIFAASMAAFLAVHFRSPIPLAVLMLVCAVQFVALGYLIAGSEPALDRFVPPGEAIEAKLTIGTVHSSRFMGTLGILPMFHLVLSLWRRRRPGWLHVTAVCVQVAILMFILPIRGSVRWQLLFVLIVAAWMALRPLWGRIGRLRSWISDLPPAVPLWRYWPVGILVAGMLVLGRYRAIGINPVYRIADELLTGHHVWHNAYIGLTYHPDWREHFGDFLGSRDGGDMEAWDAGRKYVETRFGIDGTYLDSDFFGHYKHRTYERLIRYVYLQFAKEHPVYFLQAAFLYRPLEFVRGYFKYFGRALGEVGGTRLVLLVLLLALAGAAAFGLSGADTAAWLRTAAVVLAAVLASLIQVLVYAPGFGSIVDQFFMVTFVVLCLVAGVLAAGGLSAVRRLKP